jgi:hypothetical protein
VSRLRILSACIALVAFPTTLAACGGGSDDPQTIVDEATLQGIESANLDMALGLSLKGKEHGHVDVVLSGPFRSESEAELPELDLSASAHGRLGKEEIDFDGGFTLLGDRAYVGYEGVEYEVDPTTFNFVRAIVKRRTGVEKRSEVTACQEAAAEMELSSFIENLKDRGSVDVGGTATTKISGELDVGGAVDAAIELSEDPACSEQLQAAGSAPSKAQLEKSRGELERAVKDARVDLYVGDDHIVRRISAQATVEPSQGKGGEELKSMALDFDLKLIGVNGEQEISAPSESKPLSALFVKLGINPLELLGLLQRRGETLQGPGGIDELLERIGSGGFQ